MTFKRYQIAIISFAVGILAVTFSLGWFIGSRDAEPVPAAGVEYSTIRVFFSNTKEDPGTLNCEITYTAWREISRLTDTPESRLGELAYIAIKELIKGPTEQEKTEGFFTSINEGTKVQKIFIENGVATVDFNDKLNEGVAGSCKVQAIRSQITETLKQFPEIKEVVISVNGNSEEILQP